MKEIRYSMFFLLFCAGTIFSQTTITNNPSTRYQTMKGWGTSLAWWANLVGGMPQASIDDISNRIAVDANLNFFRFNIGGGDNPTCQWGDHMRKDGGNMPGYRSYYPDGQGVSVVDVNNDYRQIAVMNKLANLRAPYGDIVTEMFSNSPPYFMTKTYCTAGEWNGAENLQPGFEDDFADYLCSVTKTLKTAHSNWNIKYIEPFNEPYSNWWKAGANQEGCKISASTQATVLWRMWQSQQTYGISDIGLVASDCNTVGEARQNVYDLWANHNTEYNGLSKIATHTYFGTWQEKAALYTDVANTGKSVWQTETGPLEWVLPPGGQWWWRHYDMAYRLIEDIRNLKSEVWCNWQAMSYDDGWGLVQQTNWNENNPYQAATFKNTRSFYIYKQIANYIKVGYTQIANSDSNSMTFVSPDNKKIVVVVSNNTTTSKDYSIDLSNFQNITDFDTYRTSGDDNSGENAKLLTSPTTAQKGVLSANRIAYVAPAWSVTTFVANVEAPVSVSLNNFDTVVPTNVVRYGSAFSIVNNPVVGTTNATAKCVRLSRTTANWYELFAFDTNPIVVPANTTYYLHVMVGCYAAIDLGITYGNSGKYVDGPAPIRPLNPYTSADINQWKDLVFAIPGGATGVTLNNIQVIPDMGFENVPARQVLSNTTNTMGIVHVDEFLISSSSTSRTSVVPTSKLNDFESAAPICVVLNGASLSIVDNPLVNGLNATSKVARVGRTTTNWYEAFGFDVASVVVPANTTYYLHMLVKYDSQPDIAIGVSGVNRTNIGNLGILPMNPYTNLGQWQDLVFAIPGGATGRTITAFGSFTDAGWVNNPAGLVLNNTTRFGYIDEIILNEDPAPRSLFIGVQKIADKSTVLDIIDVDSDVVGLKVNIYPNPTSDSVTIDLENVEKPKVQIFDINGRKLYESSLITSKKLMINIKEIITNGICFIKVTTGNKTQTQKMIVK